MSPNRKKFLASLLILLSLGIISWFLFFEYNVKKLEERLEELAVNLRQKGYTFSYSAVEITGNPLLIKAIFQNPHLKDPRGLFEWEGQEMRVVVQPWNFYTLTCTFPGTQKVSVPQNTPFPLGSLQPEGAKAVFK